MTSVSARPAGSKAPADAVIHEILDEIAVPLAVINEAKTRRKLVLDIAMTHDAARDRFVSGSVAHGTTNKPLEDADGGIVVNRRFETFRAFGPDAPGGGKGPREFVVMFADYLEPRLREHYANAEASIGGKRAIKLEFNETVEIDEWGPVDPYVDFIVGLARADGRGLWIPNLRDDTWDPGDPIHHTWLMTKRDEPALRIFRARLLRLAKRAVKRDGAVDGGVSVMCSWNLSALALDGMTEVTSLDAGLAGFFSFASAEIGRGFTEDPSPVITEPIKLPDGVTTERASRRLAEMAAIVAEANAQLSKAGARQVLAELYGPEIEALSEREGRSLESSLRAGDGAGVASVLGSATPPKPTRSYGA